MSMITHRYFGESQQNSKEDKGRTMGEASGRLQFNENLVPSDVSIEITHHQYVSLVPVLPFCWLLPAIQGYDSQCAVFKTL